MSREYAFWTDEQNAMVRAVPLATNARESAEARAQLTQIAQRIGRSPAAVRTRWYQLHDDANTPVGR